MPLDYSKLFKLLIDRRITRTEFREGAGLSSLTVSKFFRGENMNTENILRVCAYLGVQPGDIMEYVPGEEPPEPPKPKDKETKSETKSETKKNPLEIDYDAKDTVAAFGIEFDLPDEHEIFKCEVDGETKYAIMPTANAKFLRELELKLTHALEPWDKEATEQKHERIFDMYYALTVQHLEKLRTEGKNV